MLWSSTAKCCEPTHRPGGTSISPTTLIIGGGDLIIDLPAICPKLLCTRLSQFFKIFEIDSPWTVQKDKFKMFENKPVHSLRTWNGSTNMHFCAHSTYWTLHLFWNENYMYAMHILSISIITDGGRGFVSELMWRINPSHNILRQVPFSYKFTLVLL